jgi:DNA primase
VVEGYTGAIAAHQAGITITAATGGTALIPEHIEALRPVASTLTLAFDGHAASLQAAQRVAELPNPARSGFSFKVAGLPQREATPPACYQRLRIRAALADPTPLVHYLIDHIVEQHNLDEPEAVVRAVRAVGHFLRQTDRLIRSQCALWR